MRTRSLSLAARNKNFNSKILDKIKTQSKTQIESLSTKEARQLYNWNSQVASCYQRARAFSRLKISKHGIVYVRIQPEHFVEDLVARWFLSRFPQFTVMIGSPRGTFIISKDTPIRRFDDKIESLLPILEKSLPVNSTLADLEDFNDDQFWQTYYDSQFIKERKNKKYFLHNIPKKFHNWESLDTERKRFEKNKSLEEFS